MKKSTRLTIKSLAFSLIFGNGVMGFLLFYGRPDFQLGTGGKLICMVFISVVHTWFFLTHRTPEGGIDPKSFFPKRWQRNRPS